MNISATLTTFALLAVIGSSISAQEQSTPTPALSLCDPLISLEAEMLEDGDEEELTETRRYDLEDVEVLNSREQIMNAVFEEKWNFETNEPIERFELCGNEPTYVLLWSRFSRNFQNVDAPIDAEGYLRFSKDKTFEFLYATRPYAGTWELDGTEMVLTADWLNNAEPYRAPVERITTVVEATDADGNKNSYNEEMYRIGGFRFHRLATTRRGMQTACSCQNLGN